ncbi:hypothetical protein SEA_FORREST_14 [Streptomyces phage Forrest]|nr:hypothetical protein SEA_MOAB_12 [Streptomyces phage Moab]QZE11155.1 hypothetical protein SEA_FORREST_14 [Streptomyces phage Forrest]WMI33649.1 hypothetical protein SEA_PATELGO_13 [Streptomyces phage Patelgo]
MSNDKKYYQDRKLWFRRYLDARERKDEVGRRRAFKKLLELTDGKFDGTDPNK